MKIGILALQGGYDAHAKHVEALGASACLIKKPEELAHMHGLIIPGGESSTLLKLINAFNMLPALKCFYQQQKPIFGTCAGMILLARDVKPQQQSLHCLDIVVQRNAYGRQLDSFIATAAPEVDCGLGAHSVELVFIRAPKVLTLGSTVKILITHQSQPVLLQDKHVLAASFHPELSKQLTVHAYFLKMVAEKHTKRSALKKEGAFIIW